MSCDH